MVSSAVLDDVLAKEQLGYHLSVLKKDCLKNLNAILKYSNNGKEIHHANQLHAVNDAISAISQSENPGTILKTLTVLKGQIKSTPGIKQFFNLFQDAFSDLKEQKQNLTKNNSNNNENAADAEKVLAEYRKAYNEYIHLAGSFGKKFYNNHSSKTYHTTVDLDSLRNNLQNKFIKLQKEFDGVDLTTHLPNIGLANPQMTNEFYKIKEMSILRLSETVSHFELKQRKLENLPLHRGYYTMRDIGKLALMLGLFTTSEGREFKRRNVQEVLEGVKKSSNPIELHTALMRLDPRCGDPSSEHFYSIHISEIKEYLVPKVNILVDLNKPTNNKHSRPAHP